MDVYSAADGIQPKMRGLSGKRDTKPARQDNPNKQERMIERKHEPSTDVHDVCLQEPNTSQAEDGADPVRGGRGDCGVCVPRRIFEWI